MKYEILITIGCILWILSFFGEINSCQPYSTIGIVFSSLLTILGVFKWFKHYKYLRGHYPSFWKTWEKIFPEGLNDPFAMMRFILNHILQFWTFSIMVWMMMVLLGYLTFGQSNPFQEAKKYCESNKSILSKTGNIMYYGVFVGGTISTQGESGTATLSFTIVGTKGNFVASSELIKDDGFWKIEKLSVE